MSCRNEGRKAAQWLNVGRSATTGWLAFAPRQGNDPSQDPWRDGQLLSRDTTRRARETTPPTRRKRTRPVRSFTRKSDKVVNLIRNHHHNNERAPEGGTRSTEMAAGLLRRSLLGLRSTAFVAAAAAFRFPIYSTVPGRFHGGGRSAAGPFLLLASAEPTPPRSCAVTVRSLSSRYDAPPEKGGGPTYDGKARATAVLSDPHFHGNDAQASDASQALREKVLGNKTIDEVRAEYENQIDGFYKLAVSIGASKEADKTSVDRYFASAGPSVEQKLAAKRVLALHNEDELAVLTERYVPGLPVSEKLKLKGLEAIDTFTIPFEAEPISFVTGPSGSGKTTFAVHELRTFGKPKELPPATVYIQGADLATLSGVDFLRPDAQTPAVLVDKIQELLEDRMKIPLCWWGRKLNLHLNLVIDDAGSHQLCGFFENDYATLVSLVSLARSKLAASVSLVLIGTPIVDLSVDASPGCYFRMPQWTADDLEKLLEKRTIPMRPEESMKDVVAAVNRQPVLAALATNARTAALLADAIEMTALWRVPGTPWTDHVRSAAPSLLSRVASGFENECGLTAMAGPDPVHRRRLRLRIMAWLFGTLPELKKDQLEFPELDGLSRPERDLALSMLKDNFGGRKTNLRLQHSRMKFAVSVPPAIALVLFALAGVPADVIAADGGGSGFKGVAAQFAFRQLLVERWLEHMRAKVVPLQESYVKGRRTMTLDEFESQLRKSNKLALYESELRDLETVFGQSLEEISFLRSDVPVQPAPPFGDGVVYVPRASKSLVVMNTDHASFADVISPRHLISARYTSEQSGVASVNMTAELERCCLLQRQLDDSIVVRALCHIWGGGGMISGSTPDVLTRDPTDVQGSAAHPENLAAHRYPANAPDCYKLDDEWNAPPISPGTMINYVLFTNAKSVMLSFSTKTTGHHEVKVTNDMLTWDRQELDVLKLPSASEGDAWTAFLKERVGDGVRVRFIFC
jgi:hypothetical protein